jgi:histidine triad (HIT) family protein
MNCLFCENVDIAKRIIYKDKLVFVFPTNIPIVPGHLLICTVRHIQKIEELNIDELEAIQHIISRLKIPLGKIFGSQGFNYAWNEGVIAGQSVSHLHFHMLPRKEGDEGIYEYEPRKFLYRPGSREATPELELQKISELVKTNL